jgi:hypothetical protein
LWNKAWVLTTVLHIGEIEDFYLLSLRKHWEKIEELMNLFPPFLLTLPLLPSFLTAMQDPGIQAKKLLD